MKSSFFRALGLSLTVALLVNASPVRAASSDYKLGIVLVVDQFRADYLMRFKERFKGGYRKLLKESAYFPLADHGLFQNMTCPGHAAVLSGAYPYRHHISMNIWYDRDQSKREYCVEDNNSKLIGSDGMPKQASGVSPKNFNADTLGDELKNVDRASRVVSVSLKDRAAVLLGGKRSDYTVWFDDKDCEWVTSQFYGNTLPDFAKERNKTLATEKKTKYSWGPFQDISHCSKESLQTPWAVDQTFALALSAIDQLKLGKGKDTDLLTISLSSHDFLGHHFGPNHESMEAMTIEEDKMIGKFLEAVSKRLPNGLNDVFVVLTGDHGMPPTKVPTDRLKSENVPEKEYSDVVEQEMRKHFGAPAGGSWIESMVEFQIYFNRAALANAGVTATQAINQIRPRLLKERYVDSVWSRDDILYDRKSPPGEVGQIMDRTISARSGDLLTVLSPFHYSDSYAFTHMTHYSYDRYVPLLFFGKSFKPGTYRQIVRVIDIAPTLASVLHVLPPAQSEGRVITEILR